MLQEVENLSATTRRLKINVPTAVIQSESDSVYNEIKATANIPGFRTGKAPRAVLVKKFGKRVEAQVIEKVVPRFYLEAVKEANLEPVAYPDINEKLELKPGEPLSFTVTVEIKPEIGDISYDGIVLKKKVLSVEDHEVDKALNSLRESKALFSVSDDALQEGDMAIVTTEAYIDDRLIDSLSYKEYPLVLGSEEMPKEFSEALTGRKKNDITEVTLTFEPDHPNRTIAGKEVVFKVNITEAKKKHIPPLDDAFARSADCSSVDELRKKMHERLSARKESQIDIEYKREILDIIIKKHDFEVPVSMLRGEIESLIHHEKEDAMRKGEQPRPEEELKKEFEIKARDNVKSVLLLEAIGKKENIEVSEDDVKQAIQEIADRNNLKPDEVTRLYGVREGSMDALKSRLFADKVLDFILKGVTIE